MERGSWWQRIFKPKNNEPAKKEEPSEKSWVGEYGQKVRERIRASRRFPDRKRVERYEEFPDASRIITTLPSFVSVEANFNDVIAKSTIHLDQEGTEYLHIWGDETTDSEHRPNAFLLHYQNNNIIESLLHVAEVCDCKTPEEIKKEVEKLVGDLRAENPDLDHRDLIDIVMSSSLSHDVDSLRIKKFNEGSFDWGLTDDPLSDDFKEEEKNWPYGKEVVVSGRRLTVNRESDTISVVCRLEDASIRWRGKFPLFLSVEQIYDLLTNPSFDFRKVRDLLRIELSFPQNN